MAIVRSVERVSITIGNASTTGTAALTKGQVAANCVPFVTKRMAEIGPSIQNCAANVTIAGSTVTATREGSSNRVFLFITIVEFHPSFVRVQSGTISGSTSSINATILSVNLSKAAVVGYFRTTAAPPQESIGNAACEVFFSSATQVRMGRNGGSGVGAITGTYYVFEDIGATQQMKVQAVAGVTFVAPNLTQVLTLPNPVIMAKTFLLCSLSTQWTDHGGVWNQITCQLTSTTQVTLSRRASGIENALSVRVFAVELLDGTTVQRGLVNDSVIAQNVASLATPVSPSRSMPWLTTAPSNAQMTDTSVPGGGAVSSGQLLSTAHLSTNLLAHDQIQVVRNAFNADTFDCAWEVVEWDTGNYLISGVTRDSAESPLGSCQVYLLKHVSNSLVFVQKTTSDPVTGAYSFLTGDTDASYVVVARKVGPPNKFAVSDFTTTPV